MPRRISTPTLAFCLFVVALATSTPLEAQDVKTNFDDHVKTILRQRCSSCHGPDAPNGDLNVTNYTALMQGGSSGTVIEPGDPDGSYLYNLITHSEEPVMPPSGKIPDAEIEMVRKWIEMGALKNKGSKAVMKKKPTAIAMGENPTVRPEVVPSWPRMPKQPAQPTERNPVAADMATSPWAPILAVAGMKQVLLFDTNSFELKGVLPFPEGKVNVVRFSRSGSVLLAAGGEPGQSGLAVLWDVASGERIASVGDELDAVLAADISADHSMVALGGPSKLVNVYSTETGELLYTIKKHTEWVTSLAFSTDGVLLATGDRNGGLHVWESWTGRAYLTLNGHSDSITGLAWRADSNVLASTSKDTTIRTWELNNGRQLKSWGAHGGGVQAITFTRDGRILSTGADRTTKLWDQNGGQQKAFPPFGDIALSVAWCDETSRAFAGDFTGEIRAWKPDDASELAKLSTNPPTLEEKLSAAQSQLASATSSLESVQSKANQATEAAAAVQDELETAIAARNAAETEFNQVQKAMAATTEKANQLKNQLNQVKSKFDEVSVARPLVAEAHTKLKEAVGKLPSDEALKQQLAAVGKRLNELDAELSQHEKSIQDLQAKVTETTSQVAKGEERVNAVTQKRNSTNQKVTELEAKLKPLIEARDKAKAALQQAEQAVAAAKAEVDRWQGELAFVQKLNELNAQLTAAQQQFSQKQEALEQANQELQAAQQKADSAKASVDQAQKGVQDIEAQIQAARGIEGQ